jgi:catechol 2,3-dioxygenase-like lactoylglutathione lyase family enzyme
MSETHPTLTQGLHHLGLTVPALEPTKAFFTDALRFEQVGEVPDYPAVFLSDGSVMLTLWQAQDPDPVAFDRRGVVGLHHFALRVADAEALEAVHKRLAESEDVEIVFAPEPLGGGPARHMMCTIPGGIRMELIALPN